VPKHFLILADGLLIIHVGFVFFVIFGLLLVYAGCFFHWQWIRNFWFRMSHLAAIVVVVLQSWVGLVCPLTTWEMALREKAGEAIYSGSFIQHWLHALLYYSAPDWVFIVVYTSFGALVLLSVFLIKPEKK